MGMTVMCSFVFQPVLHVVTPRNCSVIAKFHYTDPMSYAWETLYDFTLCKAPQARRPFNRPYRFRQARDLKSITLCLENDTSVALYNYNMHQPILVLFGRDVAAKVCYQM